MPSRRIRFHCPACSYDVGQTLDDGIAICPECGEPITRERCFQKLPQGLETALFLVLFAPTIGFVFSLPLNVIVRDTLMPSLRVLTVLPSLLLLFAGFVYAYEVLRRCEVWRSADHPRRTALCQVLLLAMAHAFVVFPLVL